MMLSLILKLVPVMVTVNVELDTGTILGENDDTDAVEHIDNRKLMVN